MQNINRKSLEIQSIPQKSLFSINIIGFWFHFKSRKMQVAASYYLTNTYLRKMELFLFQMLLNLWQAICHTKFSKKTCACTSMCNRMVFMGKTRFNFPWKKQNLHRAYIQKPIHAEGKTTANPSVQCIKESCIKSKTNLNFYFHTSLWCFKRFYEGQRRS